MKKIALILVFFILTTACSNNVDMYERPEDIERRELWEQITKEWYGEVIEGFGQDDIFITTANEMVIAEYRVVYSYAKWGYHYYSFQVFSRGSGVFRYMVHHSQFFDSGEMILNTSFRLSDDEVENLISVIERNDFFNIPTIHPDEKTGFDGHTIFIEGYDVLEDEYNFIRMWMPEKKHGIYRIHKAFAEFGIDYFRYW
jgi:hypothetical protein